jgi:hypothetical protein
MGPSTPIPNTQLVTGATETKWHCCFFLLSSLFSLLLFFVVQFYFVTFGDMKLIGIRHVTLEQGKPMSEDCKIVTQ